MKVLADWGTTNLRGWLVDDQGTVVARHQSDMGLLKSIDTGFASVFATLVDCLGADGDTPAIISGMASSRTGWQEVPYVPVPADASAIAKQAIRIGERPHTWLVGGVSSTPETKTPEVMRGEEVQALGIVQLHPDAKFLCLPGTHSKWVETADGVILGLQTYMTGELFDWLANDSLIATQITARSYEPEAFVEGLELAAEGMALTRALFQLRTRFLENRIESDHVYAMASGLLIGHEVAAASVGQQETIHLAASGDVADSYEAAMARFGLKCVSVDPEQATLAGLLSLFPLIQA